MQQPANLEDAAEQPALRRMSPPSSTALPTWRRAASAIAGSSQLQSTESPSASGLVREFADLDSFAGVVDSHLYASTNGYLRRNAATIWNLCR